MSILTCVYCGHQYPEGTPPHGAEVLTNHIQICEKHPMKKIKEENEKLKNFLINLISGCMDKDEERCVRFEAARFLQKIKDETK